MKTSRAPLSSHESQTAISKSDQIQSAENTYSGSPNQELTISEWEKSKQIFYDFVIKHYKVDPVFTEKLKKIIDLPIKEDTDIYDFFAGLYLRDYLSNNEKKNVTVNYVKDNLKDLRILFVRAGGYFAIQGDLEKLNEFISSLEVQYQKDMDKDIFKRLLATIDYDFEWKKLTQAFIGYAFDDISDQVKTGQVSPNESQPALWTSEQFRNMVVEFYENMEKEKFLKFVDNSEEIIKVFNISETFSKILENKSDSFEDDEKDKIRQKIESLNEIRNPKKIEPDEDQESDEDFFELSDEENESSPQEDSGKGSSLVDRDGSGRSRSSNFQYKIKIKFDEWKQKITPTLVPSDECNIAISKLMDIIPAFKENLNDTKYFISLVLEEYSKNISPSSDKAETRGECESDHLLTSNTASEDVPSSSLSNLSHDSLSIEDTIYKLFEILIELSSTEEETSSAGDYDEHKSGGTDDEDDEIIELEENKKSETDEEKEVEERNVVEEKDDGFEEKEEKYGNEEEKTDRDQDPNYTQAINRAHFSYSDMAKIILKSIENQQFFDLIHLCLLNDDSRKKHFIKIYELFNYTASASETLYNLMKKYKYNDFRKEKSDILEDFMNTFMDMVSGELQDISLLWLTTTETENFHYVIKSLNMSTNSGSQIVSIKVREELRDFVVKNLRDLCDKNIKKIQDETLSKSEWDENKEKALEYVEFLISKHETDEIKISYMILTDKISEIDPNVLFLLMPPYHYIKKRQNDKTFQWRIIDEKPKKINGFFDCSIRKPWCQLLMLWLYEQIKNLFGTISEQIEQRRLPVILSDEIGDDYHFLMLILLNELYLKKMKDDSLESQTSPPTSPSNQRESKQKSRVNKSLIKSKPNNPFEKPSELNAEISLVTENDGSQIFTVFQIFKANTKQFLKPDAPLTKTLREKLLANIKKTINSLDIQKYKPSVLGHLRKFFKENIEADRQDDYLSSFVWLGEGLRPEIMKKILDIFRMNIPDDSDVIVDFDEFLNIYFVKEYEPEIWFKELEADFLELIYNLTMFFTNENNEEGKKKLLIKWLNQSLLKFLEYKDYETRRKLDLFDSNSWTSNFQTLYDRWKVSGFKFRDEVKKFNGNEDSGAYRQYSEFVLFILKNEGFDLPMKILAFCFLMREANFNDESLPDLKDEIKKRLKEVLLNAKNLVEKESGHGGFIGSMREACQYSSESVKGILGTDFQSLTKF